MTLPRKRRHPLGLCQGCGSAELVDGYVICAACRAAQRSKYAARRRRLAGAIGCRYCRFLQFPLVQCQHGTPPVSPLSARPAAEGGG